MKGGVLHAEYLLSQWYPHFIKDLMPSPYNPDLIARLL